MTYWPPPQAMGSPMWWKSSACPQTPSVQKLRLMSEVQRGWQGSEGVRGEGEVLDWMSSSPEVDPPIKHWISAVALYQVVKGSCFRLPMLTPHSRSIGSKSLLMGSRQCVFVVVVCFQTFQISFVGSQLGEALTENRICWVHSTLPLQVWIQCLGHCDLSVFPGVRTEET